MEICWNKLTLDRPPTTSWRCAVNEFDCRSFLKIIDAAMLELESHTIFQAEAAVLSRLIYRMKSKLRSDKGLKNMEKVNRALLNYLALCLEKDYKYLRDNTECSTNIQALPSLQMLQYTLVRTQGFAKLMCRIETVARLGADFFKSRMSLGQAWNISVVAYAVISRIWLLSRYLTKKCCEWYNRMYPYLNKLKIVGVCWLPENHYFPKNLKTWLNVSWIDDDLKNFAAKDVLTDSIFNLMTQREEAEDAGDKDPQVDAETTRDTIVEPNGNRIAMNKLTKTSLHTNNDVSLDDVGERISRDTFACTSKTSKTHSAKRKIVQVRKKRDVIRAKESTKVAKKSKR